MKLKAAGLADTEEERIAIEPSLMPKKGMPFLTGQTLK